MVYYGILFFFLIEYVRPTAFLPILIPLHLNSVVPIGLVVATLFSRRQSPSDRSIVDLNGRTMGLLVALMAISIVFANQKAPAYSTFTAVLGYALIGWVISKGIDNLRQIKGVFVTLVVVHIIVAAISPEMLLDPNSRTHVIASGSFLGDGNDFALSVNMAIPLCLFLLFDTDSTRKKLIYLTGLIFLALCVIASQSRGGTIALACVTLYYWSKSDKKLRMAMIGLTLFAAIMVYAPPAYFDRMNSIAGHEDGSAQGRIISWTFAWNMALQSPLFGVGAGNFPALHHQTAHSIYFLILGELGFPGLAMLLFIIIWNLVANKKLGKEIREDPSLETERRLLACLNASMIAFATAGAFLSAIYYPHLYVLTGLMSAGRRMIRERPHAQGAPAPATRHKAITYHWALAPGPASKRIS